MAPQMPPDLANDADRPDGRPRCTSVFDGKRCTRIDGHEHGCKKNTLHHIGADQSRWIVGRSGGAPQKVGKCTAKYGQYRCDRWPHQGPHGVTVHHPEGKSPSVERLQWIGNRSTARRYKAEVDDGYRTEGELQAMRLYGVQW